MSYSSIKRVFAVAIALAVLCLGGAAQNDAQPGRCPENRFEEEYKQVLDSYFIHARGDSASAVILRVYSAFLPEYELVLDPANTPGTITRYAAAKSIWGNVYSLEKSHLTIDQYVTQAEEVPFAKTDFKVSDERLQGLLSKASAIDTSICERQPMKDIKGHNVIVLDSGWFEIIKEKGHIRARVTDTDAKVISQNPALKNWGFDLQQSFGSRLPR